MGTDNYCVYKQVLCVLLVQERRRWLQIRLNRLPSAVCRLLSAAGNFRLTGLPVSPGMIRFMNSQHIMVF